MIVTRIPLARHDDERGWFMELRRDSALPKPTKQTNVSFSRQGTMEYDVLDGFWGDAGESIDAYYAVNDFVRRHGANHAG